MDGVNHTSQVLKPCEMVQQAGHPFYIAVHAQKVHCLKDAGQKSFPGFQPKVTAVLLFENGNGTDIDIPKGENIVRLNDCQFTSQ